MSVALRLRRLPHSKTRFLFISRKNFLPALAGRERKLGILVRVRLYLLLVIAITAGFLVALYIHERAVNRLLTIAVIPKTTATDYWESMHAGVLDAVKGRRINIFWNAPQSEADYEAQAEMVEDAIQQKVDAIILAPSQEFVLASAVRHAKAEGIRVVIVDSPIAVTPEHYLEYIGSDNKRIGELAASRIGSVLNGHGEVAIVGISPTVEISAQRAQAFIAKLTSTWPHIKIVDMQYGLSDPRRSESLTLDILAKHPALKAIFAIDAFATRGVYSGLKESNAEHRVRLVGVAQELDLLNQLRDGNIDALIVQDPYKMGYLAAKALENPTAHPHNVNTRVALATHNNLDSSAIRSLWSHYGVDPSDGKSQ